MGATTNAIGFPLFLFFPTLLAIGLQSPDPLNITVHLPPSSNVSIPLPNPLNLSVPDQVNVTVPLPFPLNVTISLPDVNGVVHQVVLDYQELTSEQIRLISQSVTTTNFTLYTRKNRLKGQLLTLNDTNSIKRSYWNPNKITVIVTHGWTASGKSGPCPGVRDAFLNVTDCNVIIYDWSTIADNLVYSTVAKSVPQVAQYVAKFVNFLQLKGGLNVTNLKMVGHSLGAHVMGLGAGDLKPYGLVGEVIALDPAKPLFDFQGPSGRVDSSQAKNVQAIHTCAGLLGLEYPVGHSDFYANDGRNQPGCGPDIDGSCAHGRSYMYYIESILDPTGFVGKHVFSTSMAYMGGAHLDSNATGTYFFQTKSSAPYATND